MTRLRSLAVFASLLSAAPLAAQTVMTPVTEPRPAVAPVAASASSMVAAAARAQVAPVIDGREDDAVWAAVEERSNFRGFQPTEDVEARFRTAFKVAYDDRYFYAFVRAYDPEPDSIISMLSRRDVRTNSDQIKLLLDSYHDRRSGYEFAVNPAGVKRDYTISNDTDEDGSWDGVWDVATRIDSLGWTAEYRIPMAQLRFPRAETMTFGFGVWRDVARYGERYAWPNYKPSTFGIVSQLGEVHGIAQVPAPRRLEVLPYTITKSATRANRWSDETGLESGWRSENTVSGGADIKYGVTSNLTLDATINPDFGQVEADPARVNLNVFELSFTERRPFFVEGNGILRFDVNCNDGACSGLFYSRRIGRAPQLAGLYADEDTPNASTILGAAKLTGRLGSGLSVGVLNAVTQREVGARDELTGDRQTVEPLTNYFVGRLQQDLRGGKSGIGAMLTATNRRTDQYTEDYLRRAAYAAGMDFRHRFGPSDNYQASGYVSYTDVRGDTAAIRRTQMSPVHYYQRPDDDIALDPTRTSLTGDGEAFSLSKVGGGMTRFDVSYRRASPGFEINDVGYLQRADEQVASSWVGLRWQKPGRFYRQANLNFNGWSSWTSEGLRTNAGGNVNGWMELKSQWSMYSGINVNQLPGSYNDRSAQGGPAIYRSPYLNGWFGIDGDQRMTIVPHLHTEAGRGDYGHTAYWYVGPNVEIKGGGRFSATVGPSVQRSIDDSQLYFFGDPGQFGRLDYRQVSLSTRLNYTATTNLSLQVYAEPFISSGNFDRLREVGDPRAKDYEKRYVPIAGEAVDFTTKQLRMNTVMRWEYRPGSTLYVVWSQDRDHGYDSFAADAGGLRQPGRFSPGRDFRTLFGAHPKNTLLVKASYWFSL